jgi:hypothetical protein
MNRPRNPIDMGDIASRYLAGESKMALARAYNVDKGTIRRHLKSNGIEFRDKKSALKMLRGTLLEKYEARIDRSGGINACHPWIGYRNDFGYGIFVVDGRQTRAHRWGYMNLVDPLLKDELYILHLCDNPPCQNPKHWRPGTHLENIADMVSKGRNARGEHGANAKLTWSKVTEIRDYYAHNSITQARLAERFGISLTLAHNVVRKKRWNYPDDTL